MKDFDAERRRRIALDRTFKIGGEEFHRVAGCRPETLLAWSELTGDDGAAPADGARAITLIDRLCFDLIDADDRERWVALRAREDDPVTIEDLRDVLNWLVSAVMGRPLEGSPSSPPSSPDPTSTTVSTPLSSSPGTPTEPTG